MRFLVLFLLGIVSFFYLSAFFRQIFKKNIPSLIGIIIFIVGIIISFTSFAITPPLNALLASFLLGVGAGIIAFHLLAEQYIISEKIEKEFISKHETAVERLLEILPGALTWIALTSPIWLSFALPFAVAYLILLANVYWLFSALRISTMVFLGYSKMQWAKKQDWLGKLKDDFPESLEKYYHILLIPTYKESLEILTPAFEAIVNSNYPTRKIFIAVGFEGRDDPEKIAETQKYLTKINKKLAGVFTTIHPFGLPGEVAGPGTNRNWMVKNALEQLKKMNIETENVIATTLDADFVIHPQFLAGATYKYLSTPENIRDKRSFTGVFLYNNNYWQAPTPMRVIATGTAFWQLAEMVGSDKYINFASLSMNLKALVNTGLWLPDKVNDDAGFYWKAYYYFNGDYKVIPHFLPISADTVLDVNLLKTFQNQYLQIKRWAYGVEHIPYIFRKFFTKKDMNFWDKIDKLTFVLWSYFKWGTLALFITFGGLFIPFINPSYAESVVSKNLSVISSWILTAAFIGLFATIYFNEKVAPPRPKNWSIFKKFWSYVQWILVPIVLVSITSLPAIDAQTSLMFGRYLKFRVTNKARK